MYLDRTLAQRKAKPKVSDPLIELILNWIGLIDCLIDWLIAAWSLVQAAAAAVVVGECCEVIRVKYIYLMSSFVIHSINIVILYHCHQLSSININN